MLNLQLVDPQAITKEEVEDLWCKLKGQDYYFDDVMKSRPDLFVASLFKVGNLYFKLGDYGILIVKEISPGHNAEVHFALWGKPPIVELYHTAHTLLGEMLYGSLQLQRITALISSRNEKAYRLATMPGFSLEGRLRKYILHNGQPEDLLLLGLLREEYNSNQEVKQ